MLGLNELGDDVPAVKCIRQDLERGIDTRDEELTRHATYRAIGFLRRPKRIDHPLAHVRVPRDLDEPEEHETERVRVDVSEVVTPRLRVLLEKAQGNPDNLSLEEMQEVMAAAEKVKLETAMPASLNSSRSLPMARWWVWSARWSSSWATT